MVTVTQKDGFVRIIVDESFLQTCGDSSLLGAIVMGVGDLSKLTEVCLVFPLTSNSWRQENGGPRHFVLPEFAVSSLLDDVLKLQGMGLKVTTVVCCD